MKTFLPPCVPVCAITTAVLWLSPSVWAFPTVHEPGFTAQVFATGPLLDGVSGLALTSSGLYASTEQGKILSVGWNGTTSQIADFAPTVTTLSNIVVDRQGNIIVGDAALASSNDLYRITPSGAVSLLYHGVSSPTDLHLDGSGNLLVVERFGICGVSRVANDGSWRNIVVRASDYEWAGHPTGIEMDSDGTLLLAYRDNGTIYRVPPQEAPSKLVGVGNSVSVVTLCLSPDGKSLYAANDQLGLIYRVSMDSTPRATIFASGLDYPHYMTCDSSGALYVAASGESTIYRIVPEPATLCLIAVGSLVVTRRVRTVQSA